MSEIKVVPIAVKRSAKKLVEDFTKDLIRSGHDFKTIVGVLNKVKLIIEQLQHKEEGNVPVEGVRVKEEVVMDYDGIYQRGEAE
jgi:hypothetical protein